LRNNGYKTLIAIPCYNESHTIGSVVLKAKRFAKDVIVIDDGSSDDTATVAKYAGAKVIIHKKNQGYQNNCDNKCYLMK